MEDLETRFLELLENGETSLDTYTDILKRAAENNAEMAAEWILMLDGSMKEFEQHDECWRLALWKLDHVPERKVNWEELFQKFLDCHVDHPTLPGLAQYFRKDYRKSPRKILSLLEELGHFLPGTVVRFQGKPGRILEPNLNLGVFKVRLDQGQTVSVPFRASGKHLTRLAQGAGAQTGEDEIASLTALSESDPKAFLVRIMEDPYAPFSMEELTVMVKGVIDPDRVSQWWSSASECFPVLKLHRGNRVSFRLVKEDGDVLSAAGERKGKDLLTFLQANAPAFPQLTEDFRSLMDTMFKEGDPDTSWRALKLYRKLYPAEAPDEAELLDRFGPAELYSSLGTARDRLELLDFIQDGDVLVELFRKEEAVDCLERIWERVGSGSLADAVFSGASESPAAFLFLAGRIAGDDVITGIAEQQPLFLLQACVDAFLQSAFVPFRERLLAIWGSDSGAGWLLKNRLSEEDARELKEQLDDAAEANRGFAHASMLKNMILVAFPSLSESREYLWCTAESRERKEKEMNRFLTEEIPQTRKAVADAAAMGDLRENFEYKAAREKYEHLQVLVARLREDLDRARIIEPADSHPEQVTVGTKVTLEDTSGATREIVIMGPWESDPDREIYSYESDAGKAVMEKKRGDTAKVLGETYTVREIVPA